MTVIIREIMPEGVPVEMLDAVADELGAGNNPPEGMLVHTHYEEGGRVHVLDVWESAEAHGAFADSRLRPAMGKVAAAKGFDLAESGAPEMAVTPVHRVVRGR